MSSAFSNVPSISVIGTACRMRTPAHCLRCARLRKNERAKIDPFPIHDAEVLIAAIHSDWAKPRETTTSSGSSLVCGPLGNRTYCL
jgi:hypothetical protein